MKSLIVLLGVVAMAACAGDDPVDAEGTYSVGITNRDNGCNFQNWTVGQMTSGVTVVITQNAASAVADVQGGAGFVLQVALGGHVFSGDVDGSDLDLFLAGTVSHNTGNCTYTHDGRIKATLVGDALNGSIIYTANTNTGSDCAAIQCTSTQDFSGSRPPK